VHELGRNETLNRHIGRITFDAHLAGQDDHLARHIHSGQVVAGIGLRKSLLPRRANQIRKRHRAVVDIKKETELRDYNKDGVPDDSGIVADDYILDFGDSFDRGAWNVYFNDR